MKKVLSVLLAAAMVMGMSVASFAADVTFGKGEASTNLPYNTAADLTFQVVIHEKTVYGSTEDIANLEAGDVLYFPVVMMGTNYSGNADKDWAIKINNAEYVKSAEFFYDEKATINADKLLYVKVTLEDDFDHFEVSDEVKFYFYIYDGANKNESQRVKVSYPFAGYKKETLTKNDLSWVLLVNEPTTYTYAKGEKAAKATVDFNGIAFTEFKMYAEEKYTMSVSEKYNKNLSKEYDTDVEVITFRMKNVENADILFPAAKDNKQIVAVVDGELVPVEATYVEDHKFDSGKVTDGYLVEDAEYLTYAVIPADVEIEVEAETEVEAPVEADKANPETGAADFVGAAVAMAVVSVAAAGALALKK